MVEENKRKTKVTYNDSETELIGEQLASEVKPGQVIGLYGELGAGKTCLVRGLARGLAYNGVVTSPTFTLINEYLGKLPVYHFDLYRLNSGVELIELGWEEYFYGKGICIIEWPEKLADLFKDFAYKIKFEYLDQKTRKIETTKCLKE